MMKVLISFSAKQNNNSGARKYHCPIHSIQAEDMEMSGSQSFVRSATGYDGIATQQQSSRRNKPFFGFWENVPQLIPRALAFNN